MQRVAILNNQTLVNQDYDLSRIGWYSLAWIKQWLQITPWWWSTIDISIWTALIQVTRAWTPDQTFNILFENTKIKNIEITWTDTYIWALVARVKKDVINPSNNLLNANWSSITSSDLDLYFVEWTWTNNLSDSEINTSIWSDYFWTRIGNITKQATITSDNINQNWLEAWIKWLRELEELSFSNNTKITWRNVKWDITQVTDNYYWFTVDIDWWHFLEEVDPYFEIEKKKDWSTTDKWKITYLDSWELEKIEKII